MSFYIKKLVLEGGAGGHAEVEFTPGFNLVLGPSNVGKSVIFDSIDFAWGYEPRGKRENNFKLKDLYGYDHVHLEMDSDQGNLIIDRDIYKDYQKKQYSTEVYLSGSFITPGYYPLNSKGKSLSLNTVLMAFLGIEGIHPILKNMNGDVEKLSWRSMKHMFFLPQQEIFRNGSILQNPNTPTNYTKDPAILLFLLHGIDAEQIVPDYDRDRNRKIKREAIAQFIREKRETLRTEVENKKLYSKPVRKPLEILDKEMSSLQQELETSMNSCEEIVGRITELNDRLSQNDVLIERMSALKSQYISDIDRIEFTVQGQTAFNEAEEQKCCPYCGGEIHSSPQIDFNDAVVKNLLHIKSHLRELETAEKDILAKRDAIRNDLDKLEEKKKTITARIDKELRPQIQSIQKQVMDYTVDIQEQAMLAYQENEMNVYEKELSEFESSKKDEGRNYKITDYYKEGEFDTFEQYLVRNFRILEFPNSHSGIAFNTDLYDVTFDGKNKASTMGGGYTAAINAVVAFSLQQYLHDKAMFPLGALLMDSPLSQLSEKEDLFDGDKLKTKFINLLMNYGVGQCIVAEHKEKMSEEIKAMCNNQDKSLKVNIIEFTGDTNHGRYGLLPGVTN